MHDLRRYVAILWHWAWLLILAALIAGGVAYLLSRRQVPTYQATTTVLIDEGAENGGANEYNSILTSERRARTYAELMKTDDFLAEVITALNLPFSAGDLKDRVSVTSVRDTQLIRIQVTDSDPQRAALIANTLVTTFAEQTRSLESARYSDSKANLSKQLIDLEAQISRTEEQLSALPSGTENDAERQRLQTALIQYRQSYTNLTQSFEEVRIAEAEATSSIVQVDEAQVPTSPIAPRVLVSTLLATIVGLMLTAGLVFLREALDTTVKNPAELAERAGLPILGVIGEFKQAPKEPLIAVNAPRSPVAESIRTLRTNIQFSSVDRPLRTMLITSPSPGEGKSFVAANLAAVLAQRGQDVIVVDADLRRPRQEQIFGILNRIGLSNLFIGNQIRITDVLKHTLIEHIRLIPSGPLPPNPAELLGSQKMTALLHWMQEHAAMVVIDSPPVVPVTDAAVLAPHVDGVLLIVRVGYTKLDAVDRAIEQLERVGANILGIVINGAPMGRSAYGYSYSAYYGHGTYYGPRKPGFWRRLFSR